jgi:hypothetical protein
LYVTDDGNTRGAPGAWRLRLPVLRPARPVFARALAGKLFVATPWIEHFAIGPPPA